MRLEEQEKQGKYKCKWLDVLTISAYGFMCQARMLVLSMMIGVFPLLIALRAVERKEGRGTHFSSLAERYIQSGRGASVHVLGDHQPCIKGEV